MANSKISALTTATTPLAGTEVLPIVQSNTTKQVSIANVTAGRSVSALSLGLNGVTAPVTTLQIGVSGSGTGTQDAVLLTKYSSDTDQFRWLWNYSGTGYLGIGTSGTSMILGRATGSTGAVGTTYATIDSSGNITANIGNFVQGTAAKGINFTANSAAAGMTSQLLNWYEEGTWTPAYSAASGAFTTLTYSAQTGTYVRIGKVVYIKGEIRTSNVVLGTAAGILRITGLPFTPSGSEAAIGVNLFIRFNLGTSIRITSATVDSVGIYFETSLSNDTGANQVAATEMTTGATASRNYVRFSGFYNV